MSTPKGIEERWWYYLRKGLYTLRGHLHTPGDLQQGGALLGQTLVWSGTAWVPGTAGGGGGPNLDGGSATTNYGGTTAIDGGTA